MPNPLYRSESDLLVFVSSVMTPALAFARETTTRAIESFDFGHPWVFEFTPASSQKPEDGYLRKVAEADFVIWLVGQDTTQPVADEVNQCIISERRLLAFKLPCRERSEATLRLLDSVSTIAKWQEVDDTSQLHEAIRSALSDEIVRSLRRPEYVSRHKRLSELHSLSVSNCSVAWRSLGVPEEVADELAADPAIGDVLEYPPPGVRTITGELGAGKTLAAQRLYQTAIAQAREDLSQPFPLFANAREVTAPLATYVAQSCQGYADPYVQGVLLILDGLDERGTRESNALVQEALGYAGANPKATILFTSRPVAGLSVVEDATSLPSLSDEQLLALLRRVSGLELQANHIHSWSSSMRESARNPLCAVIFGARLRTRPDLLYSSRRRLIQEVIADAHKELPDPSGELDGLLHNLATLAVERGTRVPLIDLDRRTAQHRLLLSSRIIVEVAGTVDFALPVFRDWYASRAVVEGTVPTAFFVRPVDRWLVPLAMALHSGGGTFADDLLQHLAGVDPGFASMLLSESVDDRWYLEEDKDDEPVGSLQSPAAAGLRISAALNAWQNGLGALYRLIGPVTVRGTRRPLRVGIRNRFVSTYWYHGPADREPSDLVSAVTPDGQPFPEWLRSAHAVPNTELWSWILTKGDLGHDLLELLKGNKLSLRAPDAMRELGWELAVNLMRNGRYDVQELSTREVIERIGAHDGITTLGIGGESYSRAELRATKEYFQRALEQGNEMVGTPWPMQDSKEPGPFWKSYSDRQLLLRTRAIIGGALKIYKEVVDTWFESMAHRLRMYSLLPVMITGRLELPEDRDQLDVHPILSWRPQILPVHEESWVEVELGSAGNEEWSNEVYFIEESERFARIRNVPAKEARLFAVTTLASDLLFQPRPATALALSWLEEELRDLKWDR